MIDTVEMGWNGERPGLAELAHFEKQLTGNMDIKSKILYEHRNHEDRFDYEWSGVSEKVGRVSMNANGYIRLEGRSLAKTRQFLNGERDPRMLKNDQVLTADQCNQTFQDITQEVEELFPWLQPDNLKVSRVDVVYQRRVEDSMQVLRSLECAVKPTRAGVSWFTNGKGQATGVMLRGRSVAHRCYDKGLEAGRPQLRNFLRSEEQLRSKSKGMGQVLDISQRIFNREACRSVMNERYLKVAFEGQIDVRPLISKGDGNSPMLALLILHPELLEDYRQGVSKQAFYKMRGKVHNYRASAIPVDMRVPEEAWTEQEDAA